MSSQAIRRRLLALGVVVVIAVAAAVIWLATTDGTDFCAEGARMQQARRLNLAARDFARECSNARVRAVRASQAQADRHLARARVLRRAARANNKRAKTAALRMRRQYVEGLSIVPFRAEARRALRAHLRGLRAPRTPARRRLRCRLARRLLEAGLPADARLVAYQVARTGNAGGCQAQLRALRRTEARVRTHLRDAQSWEDRDEPEAMREELAAAVALDPSRAAAVKQLVSTAPTDETRLETVKTWLGKTDDRLGSAAAWAVPILIVLLVLAALVFTAVRARAARSAQRSSRYAEAGRRHPLRWLRRASTLNVRVGAFSGADDADAAGEDVSALLVDALPRVSVSSPAFPFDRVTGESATQQAVADAAEFLSGIPQTKLLGSAVKLLTPMFGTRTAEISGRLLPEGDAGVGLALTLTGDRGRLAHSVALWEGTYDAAPGGDGAQRFFRLAQPAAAWARWHLGPAEDGSEPDEEAWEVDALFAAGEQWQSLGESVRAGVCYAKVLDLDPDHLAADYNLALLEVRSGAYALAIDRLDDLIGRIDEAALERWPMLAYAPYYLLTVALVYEGGA